MGDVGRSIGPWPGYRDRQLSVEQKEDVIDSEPETSDGGNDGY